MQTMHSADSIQQVCRVQETMGSNTKVGDAKCVVWWTIADACWGELIRQITYKGEWNEREVIKIDRYFPSSKMCRYCKFVNDGLTLDERVWTCPRCGRVLDRDGNAAGNIYDEGMRIHSGSGIESELKQKREEASPMGESVSHETPPSLAVG